MVAPEAQFNPYDPWVSATTGGVVASAVVAVYRDGVRVVDYAGDTRYRQVIVELLQATVEQRLPGKTIDYYHVVLGPDNATYRCGPAEMVEAGGSVLYYYGGRLLYASIVGGREAAPPGFVTAIVYTLTMDATGQCKDPLLDGADQALVIAASLATTLGAAYAILRFRPRGQPQPLIAEY